MRTRTLVPTARLRRVLTGAVTLLAIAVTGLGLIWTGAPKAEATAVASDFQPGYIISDAVFYDSASLSIADIQSFLNGKVATCRSTAGSPVCLKDYSQDTSAIAADAYCNGFPGGAMSAAEILARVGLSCGISPKVLVVMLQKEQGLITSTAPSASMYRSAMGMGCPDTAACDTKYYGFFNQVFSAARQMKMYILRPASYGYQLGWNNILYNPNAACGTKPVYIQNNATRVLYIYTPYTPNTAAMANLYGLGDSCSAYGNRNFWRLFTDWFGSPIGYPVVGAILTRWNALGAGASPLGLPLAAQVCDATGTAWCYQNFQNGAINWTPGTGAWETYGPIRSMWVGMDYERSPLGYPTGPVTNSGGRAWQSYQGGAIGTSGYGTYASTGEIGKRWLALSLGSGPLGVPIGPIVCGMKNNGCYQNFEYGGINWTAATGAWETYGAIRGRWVALDYERSPLGYPTGPVSCGTRNGGCYQNFEAGGINWTPSTGAWETYGPIRARWVALDYERSPVGYPTGPVTCGTADGGCYQNFEYGGINWTTASGAWETYGAIRSVWVGQDYERGPLGYPTGAVTTTNGRTTQTFQGGAVVISPWGAFATTGEIGKRWLALNGLASPLGAPTGPVACGTKDNGCYQNFVNGGINWTAATGAWETVGAIRSVWVGQDYERGPLGYPTGAATTTNGRTTQTFQGGAVVSSPSGAYATTGEIGKRWLALKGVSSPLGAPTGPIACGTKNNGCYQNFETGGINWTAATGAWETYGPMRSLWVSLDYERSPLGYPTGAVTVDNGRAWQSFEGGMIATSTAGTYASIGDIGKRWIALKATAGPLGYPISGLVCGTKNNGCYQNFVNGGISWTSAVGAWETYGPIRALWAAQDYERGTLGYPIGPVTTINGRTWQAFQGGAVVNSTAGTFATTGEIGKRWIALKDVSSPLGAPIGAIVCGTRNNGCYQNFETGAINATPTTGAWETYGAIRTFWVGSGYERGPLGYPTGPVTATATGQSQVFEKGMVTWDSATGTIILG